MDSKGILIVCIILLLVVLFNVGLIVSLTSPATREQLRMFTKLAQRARNPWQSQNDGFSELRDRVAKLERPDDAEEPGA